MNLEDSALLAAVAEGDVQAFEKLFLRYHQPVAAFLFKMTGRRGLVEELVNDVMVVVWQKAQTFAGRSRVSTWIMGVAYRKALKAIAKLGRAPTMVAVEPDLLVDEAGPDLDLADTERRDQIRRTLTKLSPEHRAVVELTYYLGYSYAEIAQIVGCPENTVKTRMFYARRKLRALIQPSHTAGREEGRTGSR